jgi:Cyclic nucleotide-binding domain
VRIESSVTAITWIPSEAIEGMPKLPFDLRIVEYDDPPPDVIENLDKLHAKHAFREANELRAWIEVRNGSIVDHGLEGRALIGVTKLKLGPGRMAFPAVGFPLIQHEPDVGKDWIRFAQTAGGRMGLPAPRRVRGKPYFQIASASAWTTLQLVLYANGQAKGSLVGASPFPRHWIYDDEGRLVEKSGTIDFDKWYRESHGENTPWGGEDTPAFVAAAETELERELSEVVMDVGGKLPRRRLEAGETLLEQGEPGDDLFLLLDGVLDVEVDGKVVAQVGPGAMLGERAVLEGGTRTATLRAVTPCRLAVIRPEQISKYELTELALTRRREEP